MPNAKIISEKHSPLGLIQVVQADGLRKANGLSYNFNGIIPVQKGIFFDGDSMSPVTPFKDSLKKGLLLFYLF